MQRFYEIVDAAHTIQMPLSLDSLLHLGRICQLDEGMRLLDLACGKGEQLVQWAHNYGIVGVGVDSSNEFIKAAKDRAYRMDVGDRVNFISDTPGEYPQAHHQFDLVSYMGRGWLADQLHDRLALLHGALAPGGIALIGETYCRKAPTEAISSGLQVDLDALPTLNELSIAFTASDFEMVEMVLPDTRETDRYESRQWMAVDQFLHEHPDDRDADELRTWMHSNRRMYLGYGREYLGWGVFVLRDIRNANAKPIPTPAMRTYSDQPTSVDYDAEMMWVHLQDGRIIGNPLSWYPWLFDAPDTVRDMVEFDTDSLFWPDLQQRLQIKTMLRGRI